MSSDDMDDEGQFSEDDYSGSDEEGSFDEDEEIGEADDTHHDTSEHARKRHKNENSKFALPTKEEQMHLRETENLMRTNLLKLQVDEMMIEIKEDVHGNKSSFIEWINNLRDAIPLFGDALSEAVTVDWLRRKGIKGISLDGAESANLSIRYHPPVSTTIVGSFLHKTSTKPFLCVDIAVIMSPLSFEAKDIINFSYFDKRKLYLGVLLQQLLTPVNGSRFGSNVHITCMKGDSRKPVILIKPNKKTPYLVRLHPTVLEHNKFPYFTSPNHVLFYLLIIDSFLQK